MQYRVMFDYTIPQFHEITLADGNASEEDIKELALTMFYELYPEAMDVEIVGVKGSDLDG